MQAHTAPMQIARAPSRLHAPTRQKSSSLKSFALTSQLYVLKIFFLKHREVNLGKNFLGKNFLRHPTSHFVTQF